MLHANKPERCSGHNAPGLRGPTDGREQLLRCATLRYGATASSCLAALKEGPDARADVGKVGQIAERWALDCNYVVGGRPCNLPAWKRLRVDDASIEITIGDSDLFNVRFGPLCGLKSDISRGPRSAMSRHMRCSKKILFDYFVGP